MKEDISNAGDAPAYTNIGAYGTANLTGTYTVGSDANSIRVMFEIGQGVPAGTILTFNSIKIEDITQVQTDAPTQKPTEAPTTQPQSGNGPIEVFGEVFSSNANNTISVVWGQNNEQIANGQKYNIYVDGVKKLTEVPCGAYDIQNISAGKRIVKITATLNGQESNGVTGEVIVAGAQIVTTTEKPTETTTQEPTTEKPTETTTQEPTTEKPTEAVKISNDIEINGFQMSTNIFTVNGVSFEGGIRTVYTMNNKVDGQNVQKFGIIYGLEGVTPESELLATSTNNKVIVGQATAAGELGKLYSNTLTSGKSYAMTLTMSANNISQVKLSELNANYYVRAYAQLADGTYRYTNVKTFSVYGVADNLYQNVRMSNYSGHEFLYNNILSRVNPSYQKVDYDWGKTIAKPSDLKQWI